MSDIVDELRKIERAGDIPPKGHASLAGRAADEIERLRFPAQPAVKLPKTNEIRKLIEDFTAPDWDTKTAFASHRRAWIVQCLELALAASALPSTQSGDGK